MRDKLSPEQKAAIEDLADYRSGQTCKCGNWKPAGHFFCAVCHDLLTPGHKIHLAQARPRSLAQLARFEAAHGHLKGAIYG